MVGHFLVGICSGQGKLGGVAQSGERLHGMQEISGSGGWIAIPGVVGSSPISHQAAVALPGIPSRLVNAGIAQVGECNLAKVEVGSSRPFLGTKGQSTNGLRVRCSKFPVIKGVQLVRIPPRHALGREFESRPLRLSHIESLNPSLSAKH